MEQNDKFWVCLSAYGLSLRPWEFCASQLWGIMCSWKDKYCQSQEVQRLHWGSVRCFRKAWRQSVWDFRGEETPSCPSADRMPKLEPRHSGCTRSALHLSSLVSLIDQCLELWYWALLAAVSGCTLPLTAMWRKMLIRLPCSLMVFSSGSDYAEWNY